MSLDERERISLARGMRLMQGVEAPCIRITRRGGLDLWDGEVAGLGSREESGPEVSEDEDKEEKM